MSETTYEQSNTTTSSSSLIRQATSSLLYSLLSFFLKKLPRPTRRKEVTATMDVNFWSSRVYPSKYLSAVRPGFLHPDNHIVQDDSDSDVDEDARACFSCPFCYVDIEVPLLCIHLEEEHCFDVSNAVCPICAANLGNDVIGHFITHHPTSLKRKKKPERSAASAMLAKKLQTKRGENKSESSPDHLFTPFICSVPFSDPEEEDSLVASSSANNNCKSFATPVLKDEDKESVERRQRAEFVQQLMISTISWSSPETRHS